MRKKVITPKFYVISVLGWMIDMQMKCWWLYSLVSGGTK
jgi:hypothetical protein